MPFQVRNNLNPQTMADNWSKGVGQSGAKLLAGYSNPRRDPQANADKSTASWQNGVSSAAPAYQAGITGYSASAAIASMQANGVSRYTQAGSTKKGNYASAAAGLATAISQAVAALPQDRSTPAARDARMTAMAAAMRQLRGKYRKNRTGA